MQNSRFVGTCLLVASLILSAAVVYHAKASPAYGRYQFHPSTPPGVIWILDTTTGEVRTR